jgi:hypothetical protein
MNRPFCAAFLICISGGCDESATPTGISIEVGSAQITVSVDWAFCQSAPTGTQVTFDDLAVPLVSSGGQMPVFGGGSLCESASFVLDTATDFSAVRSHSTVNVTSGKASGHATFDSLVAPRSLAPVSGDVVTAGAPVTFQLTPSTDTILVVNKLRWDTGTGLVAAKGAVVVGSTITADVPVDVMSGDALTFSWGPGVGVTLANVHECTGVGRCVGQPLVVPVGGVVHVQ